jgi:hypothetical protein
MDVGNQSEMRRCAILAVPIFLAECLPCGPPSGVEGQAQCSAVVLWEAFQPYRGLYSDPVLAACGRCARPRPPLKVRQVIFCPAGLGDPSRPC